MPPLSFSDSHAGSQAPRVAPRVAMIINMPAPYRLPVYHHLGTLLGRPIDCIYTTEREPNRQWQLNLDSNEGPRHHFLPSKHIQVGTRYVYFTQGMSTLLRQLNPEVVITTAFSQPYLQAAWYAWRHNLPHIAFTDGTLASEASLGALHRWIRRRVFKHTHAFVGASLGSQRLYASYGVPPEHFFQSHLCANMDAFTLSEQTTAVERDIDFIFSGRMEPVKCPLFALEVAIGVAKRLGRRVRMDWLGSGSLLATVEALAQQSSAWVESRFLGFLPQADLPAVYRRGRLFLFPTQWDPWGVVANEASAAGMPTMTTPVAGCAGELVRHQITGFVLPLDLSAWIDSASQALQSPAEWLRLSEQARATVSEYTYARAAQGLADAIECAMHQRSIKDNDRT